MDCYKVHILLPSLVLASLAACINISAQSASSLGDMQTLDPLLESGREAFMNYEFDAAQDYYTKYATRQRKARKETDPILNDLQRQLDIAAAQFERVQDIVVIDSIPVRASDFFRHIRIPASAGYLLPSTEIPFAAGRDAASMAFTPESQSVMLWAQPDSTGTFRIVESLRLADGRYSEPQYAPEFLNGGGDADFPVLCADGLTLYYSSDGENSMGGYDIFETVRDAQTGEYMPPSNVGMPFNSPYDDFLLVADEENGVGWWATDRNGLGEYITLYVYMLPDMRRNFDGDDEDRLSRARVDNYHLTWVPDYSDNSDDSDDSAASSAESIDYARLASEIRRIQPGERPKAEEFYLPLNGGKVYTRYDELPDAKARSAVRAYMDAVSKFEKEYQALRDDRRKYDKSRDNSLGLRIRQQEEALDKTRETVSKLLIDVYGVLR